jgi:hypothetical protein
MLAQDISVLWPLLAFSLPLAAGIVVVVIAMLDMWKD